MRFVVAVATLLMLASGAAATRYTVTTLPNLGYQSFAEDINDLGHVTGAAYSDEWWPNSHPFLYDGTTMRDLGTHVIPDGTGWDINNLGQVVGFGRVAGVSYAFFYNGVEMIDIGTLGGPRSSARDINDLGQITGTSSSAADAPSRAFIYENGAMRDLGTLGGSWSGGGALNSSGQVTGTSSIAGDSEDHAFFYDGVTMHDLGTFGGSYSQGNGINDAGHIVGESWFAGNEVAHAFYYDGSAVYDLGALGGSFSSAADINNEGQIIGNFDAGDGYSHAFIYSDGVMRDLNNLIGLSPEWVIIEASAINNRGQIVAQARNRTDFTHRAVILTPILSGAVPEPASWALMLGGFGVIGMAIRRRSPQAA